VLDTHDDGGENIYLTGSWGDYWPPQRTSGEILNMSNVSARECSFPSFSLSSWPPFFHIFGIRFSQVLTFYLETSF